MRGLCGLVVAVAGTTIVRVSEKRCDEPFFDCDPAGLLRRDATIGIGVLDVSAHRLSTFSMGWSIDLEEGLIFVSWGLDCILRNLEGMLLQRT
jgi:hypothetical protein